jgi:hypothetical protein
MIASRFSLAPFGEPGRVTITVLPRTPATGLDIIATRICQRLVLVSREADKFTYMALLSAKRPAFHVPNPAPACAGER